MTSSTTESELALWRCGFTSDGFSLDSCLPPGWMRKWLTAGGWWWVSPEFKVIKNQKSLVQYIEASMCLEKNKVEELVNLLISNPPGKKTNKNPTLSRGKGSYDFDWQEDDSLPEGWKLAYYTPALATMVGSPSEKFIKLLSPAGKCLSGRTIALRHMVAQKYSQISIDKMQSGLWKDNYKSSEFLPKGWMVREKPGEDNKMNFNFLSPSFDTIKSVKKLMAHLKNWDYEDKEINDTICHFKRKRKTSVKKSRILREQLELLPTGKGKLGSRCGVNLGRQENRRGVNIYR